MDEVKKIIIVVNVDWFFLSHRLQTALEAKKSGYDVTILTADTGKIKEIKQWGFKVIPFVISRGKETIFNEIRSLATLIKIYKKQKPYIIHHVGLKLILYGTIAKFFAYNKAKVLNALSGAGTLFTNGNGLGTAANILLKLFHLLNSKTDFYVFQNKDDLKLFQGLSSKVQNFAIIKGSGVDLDYFKFLPYSKTSEPLKVLFVGRILKEKGICEFIDAANDLKYRFFGKIKFIIVGEIDLGNPSSLTKEQILACQISDYIEWHGHQDNVYQYMKEAYMVVLPSYREGLPKTLIEACAVGRPIITTNAIGCREVVDDEINGYLVDIKDSRQLSEKIKQLIENQDLAIKMGLAARAKAENEFDSKIIHKKFLEVYKNI